MRIIKSLIISVILLVFINATAWAEKPVAPESLPGVTRINANEAVELIMNTPDLVIIDSRKESEYSKGHIQGAISLLDTEMTLENLGKHAPDKTRALLFYCDGDKCLRSSNAATHALDWGYKKIYWFRGGWSEWIANGLPVSR